MCARLARQNLSWGGGGWDQFSFSPDRWPALQRLAPGLRDAKEHSEEPEGFSAYFVSSFMPRGACSEIVEPPTFGLPWLAPQRWFLFCFLPGNKEGTKEGKPQKIHGSQPCLAQPDWIGIFSAVHLGFRTAFLGEALEGNGSAQQRLRSHSCKPNAIWHEGLNASHAGFAMFSEYAKSKCPTRRCIERDLYAPT